MAISHGGGVACGSSYVNESATETNSHSSPNSFSETSQQVLMPAVGMVGVLGNLGAILILMRPEMRSTFHHSLLTLAIVDVLFVVTLIVDTQVNKN